MTRGADSKMRRIGQEEGAARRRRLAVDGRSLMRLTVRGVLCRTSGGEGRSGSGKRSRGVREVRQKPLSTNTLLGPVSQRSSVVPSLRR